MDPWSTSNRAALFAGLIKVLKDGLPHFKTIRRQSLDRECVSDGAQPALLIDEASSSYEDEHEYEGEQRCETVLIFDLQATGKKSKEYPLGNIQIVREVLVSDLFKVLRNNRTLNCTLKDEDQPQDHARNIFMKAEVRYVKTKWPKVRVLVTIKAMTSENFLERPEVNYSNLILTGRPSLESEFEKEVSLEL